jgi:uncharacterized repeat protein (TIGR01451 family)
MTDTITVVPPHQNQSGVVKKGSTFTTGAVPSCGDLAVMLEQLPQHGTLVTTAAGVVTYTPDPSYTGDDNFTYSVECSPTSSVSVTVDVDVIDPSGIVYDAVSRVPVRGATVTLLAPSGEPLPDSLLDLTTGGPNGQVTGADGRYALMLRTSAPSGIYLLRVQAPAGYRDAPATSIPPAGSLYTPALGAKIEYIQEQDAAPTLSQPVPYYLAFRFQLGSTDPARLSNGVAHNHVPLDRVQPPLPLVVTKTSAKRQVSVGELVPYRITVRAQGGEARGLADVFDLVPAGMRYVPGSGMVNGIKAEPAMRGNALVWPRQIIPANGSMAYDLTLSVGAGVVRGSLTNVALVRGADGAAMSNRGEAAVAVRADRVLECTDVIGKVFEDLNGDGVQGAGEGGIAKARLATVNGLLITTDAEGRYHIDCAAVPDQFIGSNFVLKLDLASLPAGYVVTGQNPASARLTSGLLHRINFAVARRSGPLQVAAADFDADGTMPAGRFADLVRQLAARPSSARTITLRYLMQANESPTVIENRLDQLERRLRTAVPAVKLVDREVVQSSVGRQGQ